MNPEIKLVVVKVFVLIGLAFTACALTLGIVTYVIPNWFEFVPTETIIPPTAWEQVNRTRGIFQECTVIEKQSVTPKLPYIKVGDCFQSDFGEYTMTDINNNDSYFIIQKIRLSQLILHGISLPLSLIILFIGIGIMLKSCFISVDSTYYIKWRLTFSFISILIFLLMCSSGSLATALAFIESNSSYKTNYLPYSQFNLNVSLKYGNMYILSWVSAAFSLIAAIFFFITVCFGTSLEEQKYKPKIISVDNPTFSGDDNVKPIFLSPSVGSSYERTFNNSIPNDTVSPGLLPRYNIYT